MIFLVLTFGQVSGVEFSPGRFERRTYFFYQLPIVQVQIMPAWRSIRQEPAESYLTTRKLVRRDASSTRWDVISVRTSDPTGQVGEAQALTRYLDQLDANQDAVWVKWSDSHPKAARHFWTAVQGAAKQRAYELIPGLFRLASQLDDDDDVAFAARMDEHLTKAYTELGDDYLSSAQRQRAGALYASALELSPTDDSLREKIDALSFP